MLIHKIIENWELNSELEMSLWMRISNQYLYLVLLVLFALFLFSPMINSFTAQVMIAGLFSLILLAVLFLDRYGHMRISKGKLIAPAELVYEIIQHHDVPCVLKWDLWLRQKRFGQVEYNYLLWLDSFIHIPEPHYSTEVVLN